MRFPTGKYRDGLLCTRPFADYNASMRKLVPTVAAFLLLGVLVAQVQSQPPNGAGEAKKGKGAPKGGGGGLKNVQVINQATLPETMQSFVQALGLLDKGACAYCHVEDRSSDEKMQKVIARNMIIMVKDINARFSFPAGEQLVTCWTCHRGNTKPETAP